LSTQQDQPANSAAHQAGFLCGVWSQLFTQKELSQDLDPHGFGERLDEIEFECRTFLANEARASLQAIEPSPRLEYWQTRQGVSNYE